MTQIQQVLFELETDYLGNPYYVSSHALYSALARRVDAETRQSLQVGHGVFLPGEYGSYPDAHSQSGGVPYLGTGLRPVDAYEDLFLFRDPAQRWLSDSRPRDAHNIHDLALHGGRVAFASTCSFGRPPSARNTKRTVTWYLQYYLHAAGEAGTTDARPDVVPLPDEVLDGLRLGGARNYGLGETRLKDTQTVDLEALDYSRLEDTDAETFQLELVSPYVLSSSYPGADDQSVPWWWTPRPGGLRRREERLVKNDEIYELTTIDHGQVVGFAGPNPVQTAMNGVLRVGTHSRFGFGEFRLRPTGEDRVPEREAGRAGTSEGSRPIAHDTCEEA
ncbi:hypothetical protein ACERIT_06800 [Halopenitus sp. H-Gu1]|uniref:hypothetical protein n=1 Tax=Halopenitus sp. H-Gu1 TaxID=3242697 RepID=UPI00359D5AC0